MSDLRIGLVGCGAMGRGHLAEWPNVPNARVTAVCDPFRPAAEAVAAGIGARAYEDLNEMVSSGEIDAVDICTPSGLHAQQGLLAAAHGLHVLVEKPLDLNLTKADQLIAACEERGLILACIFQRRTYEGPKRVAEAIRNGEFGDILSCSAYVKWWRSPEYYASSGWRGTWAMDCGVLANQAVHAIDLMCWLAGRVACVEYAALETRMHEMEAEDYALAALRFANGARGVVEATTCCNPDLCTRVEIYGTRGAAAFDDATVVKFGVDGQDRLCGLNQNGGQVGGGSEPMAISTAGHLTHMRDFVECVRTGRQPIVSGRDARASLEAIHLIYQKAFPGQKLGL